LALADFVRVSVCLRADVIFLLVDGGGKSAGDLDGLLLLELEKILGALRKELQRL
jgi:hypothetical protein